MYIYIYIYNHFTHACRPVRVHQRLWALPQRDQDICFFIRHLPRYQDSRELGSDKGWACTCEEQSAVQMEHLQRVSVLNVCVYVCMHTYIHTYTLCMHACMHIYTYACSWACTCEEQPSIQMEHLQRVSASCVCVCMCVCVYIYIYISTHIHARICMYKGSAGACEEQSALQMEHLQRVNF
jgi:hypothetical protein